MKGHSPIHSTAPDAYIVFFPYKQEQTKVGDPFKESYLETSPLFVRSELLSVSTSKPKTGAGSWSCTLSSSKNYKSMIHPGCWVMIYISDEPLDKVDDRPVDERGLKMIGQVKSVRRVESVDPSTGTKSIRYDISGVDFHGVLESQVYINRVIVDDRDPNTKPIIDALVLFKKTFTQMLSPDEAVRNIIEAVLGKPGSLNDYLNTNRTTAGGTYAIPSEVSVRLTGQKASNNKFVDILAMFLQKNLVGKLVLQPELGNMFSAFSLAQTYSHSILNELYSELLPVKEGGSVVLKPAVVLRAIPFSSPKGKPSDGKSKSIYKDKDEKVDGWITNCMLEHTAGRTSRDIDPGNGIALYVSKEVTEDEIFSLNYGKSDAERFNFFLIMSNVAIENGLDGVKLYELTKSVSISSLTDPNSVARHGLRPYITNSEYLNLSEDHITQVNRIARDLWQRAHLYENGSVNIHGSRKHIPVGTNIVFKDRGWIAHVEKVDHHYGVQSSGHKDFRTTISFVRLQTLSGEPIDLIDQEEEHEWDRKIGHSLGKNLTKKDKE